jgi:L-asparagine transporter-like permease
MGFTFWIAVIAVVAIVILIAISILFWPKDGSF